MILCSANRECFADFLASNTAYIFVKTVAVFGFNKRQPIFSAKNDVNREI